MYHLPYGNAWVSLEIPEKYKVRVLKSDNHETAPDENEEIKRALEYPVKSKRLSEIARTGRNAVIIVSDATRPTPTARLLPPLISELNIGGIRDITVVFGIGIHRKLTEDEKRAILGGWYDEVKSIEHDANNCVYLGTTSRGTPVEIFKPIAEADIVVCTGTIEFHYYAGYSGGAKSILPAVSSKRSIDANHALMLDPGASAGRLDSPVRKDLEEAASFLGIDFILNVVLNEKKEIIFAAAGDHIEAHRKGAEFLDKKSRIKVEPSDIIIVSPGGWPKDIDIFQSHKAIEHVRSAVKEGGSIILVAECREGYGNRVFEEWLGSDRDEVIERFKSGFVMGGHKAALIAALSKKLDLYLVSSLPEGMARRSFFIPATLKDALDMALRKNKADANIIMIPYGGSILASTDT